MPSHVLSSRSTVRFRPPRFGLGGSQLGDSDEQTAIATVDAAYQAGIRFFDTSAKNGASEERLGRALQPRPRGEYLLSIRTRGEDPEGDVRRSSERLGLAVDLVLAANAAEYPVLEELRRDGVIKAVGAVADDWQQLDRLVQEVDLDCVLLTRHYSLLDRQARPLLDSCQARGVSVIVSGALVLRPETVKARRISAVCERYGVSLPQAALAFPGRHPAVTSVLITAKSPAEIRADAALVRRPVPERLWKDPELLRLLSS
ncbi:aldo/keto reductase [Kribbella jejuensis]|uniref:D-threo-aldose 1-dehydrogenase n=1 Tax=Kribbella jejuensis TaxID=236068 RepID=A0A542DB82_9ACTN|nr:aldo/keto reductase [Kribbella jejuensis]TQJ00338.1 D-threo-aldose 1-dehydrogenase [Kribbella jejuensis]